MEAKPSPETRTRKALKQQLGLIRLGRVAAGIVSLALMGIAFMGPSAGIGVGDHDAKYSESYRHSSLAQLEDSRSRSAIAACGGEWNPAYATKCSSGCPYSSDSATLLGILGHVKRQRFD